MISNDFKYSIDYNIVGYYSCKSSGCMDEGICRCYKITGCEILKLPINKISSSIFNNYFDVRSQSYNREYRLFGLINNVEPLEFDFFWDYVIKRLLTIHKIYQKENWLAKWSSGYYGDEIDSIEIKDDIFKNLISDINRLIELGQIDKIIEFLIEKEYGYILDKIKDKSYTIEEVKTSDIVFPQESHYKKVLSEDLSYLDEMSKDDIQGLCIKDGDKYKVIDGYHRLAYYKNKIEKITIISIC